MNKKLKIRHKIAILLAKLTNWALKLLGKNGEALPGFIALKLCPDILSVLTSDVKCICVTGTNGKTTTTHFIRSILEHWYPDAVMKSITGVNLPQSVVWNFIKNGDPKWKYAVIECDEDYTPVLFKSIKPDVIVVTNISEDQVSRFPSVEYVRDRIVTAIATTPDSVLCLNANDELTMTLAEKCSNTAMLFGKKPEISGKLTLSWNGISKAEGEGQRFSLRSENGEFSVKLAFPGSYNAYNAMAALCSCSLYRKDMASCASMLENVQPCPSRMETMKIGCVPMRTILAKNVASFDASIEYITTLTKPVRIVIAQAAEIPDDMDTAWVAKVNLKKLRESKFIEKIFVTGTCAEIWADHLYKSGFTESDVCVFYDFNSVMNEIVKQNSEVIWLPCYSESCRIEKEISRWISGNKIS